MTFKKMTVITVTILLTSLVLLSGLAVADRDLPVKFISQVPPGAWGTATKNCGQTSSLMVYCYYDGTTPTAQGIKDIDDWLYQRFGASQAINNYNGSETSTSILETLSKERGGKYGSFPLTYKAIGWTVARVKQEIDAGHPVIVAVTGSPLGQKYGKHLLVAKGYTSTGIITNDPGRSNGQLTYTNSQFASAMSSQGGAVLVVIPYPPISITSPTGGNYWPRGTIQKVQWQYTGNPGSSVRIDLLQGSKVTPITFYTSIGSGGKGSYSWWVSQPAGQYQIRVTINAPVCAAGYITTSNIFYIR